MFTVDYRNQVRQHVLNLAQADSRIVAGAVVGSLALTDGDRWSDLDLTFGVADGIPVQEVLNDWTSNLIRAFNAIHLFDLPSGASIYRVFLLPGCLQFDLSFTPADQFGATGPKFKLLFGTSVEKHASRQPSLHELFGYAVHHALRARFCIARGRYWQAEYWISSLRDYALNLACHRRGLPTSNGRGYDDLPVEIRNVFLDSFVTSLDHDDLLRALTCAVDGLFFEVDGIEEITRMVEPQLRQLLADPLSSV